MTIHNSQDATIPTSADTPRIAKVLAGRRRPPAPSGQIETRRSHGTIEVRQSVGVCHIKTFLICGVADA